MTVRTAYVATESVGDVLTAANFDKLPGGWIGYAEVTTDQGTFTTITDLTSLAVTVTVNSNRRIKITGFTAFASSVATDSCTLSIRESGTTLAASNIYIPATVFGWSTFAECVLTPSAGSHTYKLSGARLSGSGNITMKATSTAPSMILVTDLGPDA